MGGESSSAMLAFKLMTTPPLTVLAFSLARCNRSHQKVIDLALPRFRSLQNIVSQLLINSENNPVDSL